MILNTQTNNVSPYELLKAMKDMVKIYKQTYDEALKLFPDKKEAHVVATNIMQVVMGVASKKQQQ